MTSSEHDQGREALFTEEEDRDEEDSAAGGRPHRRSEDMDRFRAQMLTEGYPVAGLSQRDNDVVWKSLVARTRRPQLMALTVLTDAAIDDAIKTVRKQRQATGRK